MNVKTFDKLVSKGTYHPKKIMMLYAHFVEKQAISRVAAQYGVDYREFTELSVRFANPNQPPKANTPDVTYIDIDSLSPQFKRA